MRVSSRPGECARRERRAGKRARLLRRWRGVARQQPSRVASAACSAHHVRSRRRDASDRHPGAAPPMELPPNLHDMRKEIEGYAREYGLDFWDVSFEVLTYDEMNMVAAYGG